MSPELLPILRSYAPVVRLRRILASHTELADRLEQLEMKHDDQFRGVLDSIRQLMRPDVAEKEPIGFKVIEEVGAYQ